MSDSYYTLGDWRVRPGNEAEFLRVWKEELAPAFRAVSSKATGTLVQSLDNPLHYYSFGPWDDLETIKAARADPRAAAALARLVSLCDQATPGAYRVVLTVGT